MHYLLLSLIFKCFFKLYRIQRNNKHCSINSLHILWHWKNSIVEREYKKWGIQQGKVRRRFRKEKRKPMCSHRNQAKRAHGRRVQRGRLSDHPAVLFPYNFHFSFLIDITFQSTISSNTWQTFLLHMRRLHMSPLMLTGKLHVRGALL